MQTITFDQLPEAVANISERLNGIEKILSEKNFIKPENEVLTIDQAAEILSLSKFTIYSLVNKRQIPFMKKQKRLYFLRGDLMAWLKEGSKKAF